MSAPANLPLDVIVSTVMHETQHEIDCARARGPLQHSRDDLAGITARRLLMAIANRSDLTTVLFALDALRVPSSIDMISEGLQAVIDSRPALRQPPTPPVTIRGPEDING